MRWIRFMGTVQSDLTISDLFMNGRVARFSNNICAGNWLITDGAGRHERCLATHFHHIGGDQLTGPDGSGGLESENTDG